MEYNKEFTDKLAAYLNAPEEERDINEGATMLLQMTRNHFMYTNITKNPIRFKAKLFYELQKQLKFRLLGSTEKAISVVEKEVEQKVEPDIDNFEARYKGKRADHDSLPDEIKALYVENASLMKQMRDLHTKLRLKSDEKKYKPCDRFEELTLLIDIHKKYTDNWEAYDHAQIDASKDSEKAHTTDSHKSAEPVKGEENEQHTTSAPKKARRTARSKKD